MVRGLAQHITETNISDDIQNCGLTAKDIRLIRKKETGTQKAYKPNLVRSHQLFHYDYSGVFG